MKKALLSGLRKFDLVEETPPDRLSDSDVLIKISTVGICGSDIHYYRTGRIGDQIINYPFTPGHECTGIVVKAGIKVKTVKEGDRIAIDPAISCGECDQCLNDRKHTCRNLRFLGNPGEIEGCLQEYIVLPENCCIVLPDTISLKEGIILEPLTIALHAVGFNSGRKNFAILGCGPIGICTLFALKYQLFEANIFVTDKIDSRLSFAKKKGALWTGNPLKEDVVADMLKINPSGMDTVFECCGQQEAIDQAIDLLKPGGQLVIVGIPEADHLMFDAHNMRRKEISIYNVRRQNNKFHQAIELLAKKRIDIDGFVSHMYNVVNIQDAFELVESYHDNVIKAVVRFDKAT
jgi:L-iditol 2-dehydrogenase